MIGDSVNRYFTEGFNLALTADGDPAGLLTVGTTADLVVGMFVWLSSTTQTSIRCRVSEIVSSTTFRVTRVWTSTTQSGDYRFVNVELFLLADSAAVDVEPQVVQEA